MAQGGLAAFDSTAGNSSHTPPPHTHWHRLETAVLCHPKRHKATIEAAAYVCASSPTSTLIPLGRTSTREFPPGPHGPVATSHPHLPWSFPSWALCPAKHNRSRGSRLPPEEQGMLRVGSEIQTSNLLCLHKSKADLGLGRPVNQMPMHRSQEGCVCVHTRVHACSVYMCICMYVFVHRHACV